ncbi:MAG: hypothetical protein LQ344_007318 [Seirophora lacunosa]|nr:MAG: hypothetical protein LQ344_007318 [Seirophora lacunosa]
MSKRKRENEDGFLAGGTDHTRANLSAQRQSLENVLERSKQPLFQALKLARGFERQKLGRRQKVAKAAGDDGDSERLAAEVAALKSFELYNTAEAHLYESLLKTKSIASAPTFPSVIESKLKAITKPLDVAHANVQARLFNSQPVKKAMDDCMGNIRASLGFVDLPGGKRKRMRKADYKQELEETPNRLPFQETPRAVAEIGEEKAVAGVPLEIHGQPWDREQVSSDDGSLGYGAYESRLAGSSDESFRGFSEVTDYHSDIDGRRARLDKTEPMELSLSPSLESSDPDHSGTSDSLSPYRRQAPTKDRPNTKATTFLPSLALGGYWSGSEAASDEEGRVQAAERKNRRGQRERRLIAEKKFGHNANHLKMQRGGNDRDQSWDARKGAQADDGRGKRGRGRGGKASFSQAPRFARGAASSSGANSDPVGQRRDVKKDKPADGPLHPSWQAAKAAKEQKKAAAFQGKKVVFS